MGARFGAFSHRGIDDQCGCPGPEVAGGAAQQKVVIYADRGAIWSAGRKRNDTRARRRIEDAFYSFRIIRIRDQQAAAARGGTPKTQPGGLFAMVGIDV